MLMLIVVIAITTVFVLAACDNNGGGGTNSVPVITIPTQPADVMVTHGAITGNLTVSAAATEGATLTFQWQKQNGIWVNIAGATGAIFAIPTDLSVGNHNFRVVVSAMGATAVTSSVATVAVQAAGDTAAADNLAISNARTVIENATFTALQANAANITQARAAVQTIINGLTLDGVTPLVVDGNFTAATSGTEINPNGTNGSFMFTVRLNRGVGAEQTTSTLTLIITATAFSPPTGVYTITLEFRGGAGTAQAAEVTFGESFALPIPTTMREHSTFRGWYSDILTGIRLTDSIGAGLANWSLVGNITVYAYWYGLDDLNWTLIDGGEAWSVARGTTTYSTIVLPSVYLGLPVTTIANNAWQNNPNLASITLPNGLLTIGNSAFEGAVNLSAIVIPASVVTIGNSAFALAEPSSVNRLQSITFADNSSLVTIGVNAFRHTALTTITIPKGVSSITGWAQAQFMDAALLEYIAVEADSPYLVSINGVLYRLSGGNIAELLHVPQRLAGEVVIPYGVTAIHEFAFWSRLLITSVYMPNSVTSIGHGAFSFHLVNETPALVSVRIGSGTQRIEEDAFRGIGLARIELPLSVTFVGPNAFAASMGRSIGRIYAEHPNPGGTQVPSGWSGQWRGATNQPPVTWGFVIPRTLDAPLNITMSSGVISWDSVIGAVEYSVQINNETPVRVGSSLNSINFLDMIDGDIARGTTIIIRVQAIGNGISLQDSPVSEISYIFTIGIRFVAPPTFEGGDLFVGDALPAITTTTTGGTITIDDGQTLIAGTNYYDWTFVPNNTTDYYWVGTTGTISLTAIQVISYIDHNGNVATIAETYVTKLTVGQDRALQAPVMGWAWYMLVGEVPWSSQRPILTVSGNIIIILADNSDWAGGIVVETGSSVTIFAQSTGANMGMFSGFIGGRNGTNIGTGGNQALLNGHDAGRISIYGGRFDGIRIGGGDGANATNVGTILGGHGGHGGEIRIAGGEFFDAQIGGGHGGNGRTVTGSAFTAPGIGGDGGIINIDGGLIHAVRIGGGNGGNGSVSENGRGGDGGLITITGGRIYGQEFANWVPTIGGGRGGNSTWASSASFVSGGRGGAGGNIFIGGDAVVAIDHIGGGRGGSATTVAWSFGGRGGVGGFITLEGSAVVTAFHVGGGHGAPRGGSSPNMGEGGHGGDGGVIVINTQSSGQLQIDSIGAGQTALFATSTHNFALVVFLSDNFDSYDSIDFIAEKIIFSSNAVIPTMWLTENSFEAAHIVTSFENERVGGIRYQAFHFGIIDAFVYGLYTDTYGRVLMWSTSSRMSSPITDLFIDGGWHYLG